MYGDQHGCDVAAGHCFEQADSVRGAIPRALYRFALVRAPAWYVVADDVPRAADARTSFPLNCR